MEVLWESGHTLRDGRTVDYYRVGDWSFEYIRNEDGTPDMESDADPVHSRRSAEVLDVWATWLENGGPGNA